MKKRITIITMLSALLTLCANATKIGNWPFDEGSGQWTYNSVSGGIDLRFGSSDTEWADPTWTSAGSSGYGILFENSYTSNPDLLRPTSAADLSAYNTGTFTFGARINLTSVPASGFNNNNPHTIFAFSDSSGSTTSYMLRLLHADDSHAQLNAYFYDSTGSGHSFSSTILLSTGTWYQVGFSHDGSTLTSNTVLWVDGVSETTSIAAHPRTNLTISGASLTIGAMGNQIRGFDGIMDEVEFYDEVVPIKTTVSIGEVDITMTDTQIVVNWQGDIAGAYALQSRDSLVSGTWNDVVQDIAGGNGIISATNDISTNQQYYRVVLQ